MKDIMIKIACVAVLVGIGIQPKAFSQELKPEQALQLRQAVTAWLECEECTEGQLAAVLKQGELAVPSLGAALERGPSPASLERLQLHLERNYREMAEYARTHDEVKMLGEKEYLQIYLDNYRANHAARAAEALGKIGGANAQKILEGASKLALRADVLQVVQNARRVK